MNRVRLHGMILPGVMSLAIILSGCQNLAGSAPEGGTGRIDQDALAALILQRETILSARNTFQVKGGLGIWTDTETISARLDWQQSLAGLNLTLDGPLGMGTLRLIDDGVIVIMNRGDKMLARGTVADTVLQQGLGLAAPVPVGELRFWIRGLPGNATAVVRDDDGKLSSLRYTDTQGTRWQARFRRYTVWDDADVPSLITASGGPYSVRLRLNNWQYETTTVIPAKPESNNRLPIPGR